MVRATLRFMVFVRSQSSYTVQTLAVVSNPGMITIHSIQNGAVERAIPIALPDRTFRVTGTWWFREEKKSGGLGLPEVFKRGDIIVWLSHVQFLPFAVLKPVR